MASRDAAFEKADVEGRFFMAVRLINRGGRNREEGICR